MQDGSGGGKKRVLFVDDDRRVLAGLANVLHRDGGRWDFAFAGSGEEALERLAAEPFDAVVSDMRMPGIDGVELLEEVRRRAPSVVRIMLSGSADDYELRGTTAIEQLLLKPCSASRLRAALDRLLTRPTA